jgi:hypothetical protein
MARLPVAACGKQSPRCHHAAAHIAHYGSGMGGHARYLWRSVVLHRSTQHLKSQRTGWTRRGSCVVQCGRHHRPGAPGVQWARSLARLTLHDRQRCKAWQARASVWWGKTVGDAKQGFISALGFVVAEAMLCLHQGGVLDGCLQGCSLRAAKVCSGGLQSLPRLLQDGVMGPIKGAEDGRPLSQCSLREGRR